MRNRGTLRRGLFCVVAVVLVGAGLAGCGSSDSGGSGSSSKSFIIYMSADQSGPTKSYTEAEIGGLQAAIDKLNAEGGIEGRKAKLETADDQNDPTKAVNLLQKRLSSGPKPDLVYAGGSSSVTASLLPVLTRNKILSMSGSSAATLNDPKKFPYFFGTVFTTNAYVIPMEKEIQQHGYKTVAMLHSNDTSGQAAAAIYKETLAKDGVKFVDAGYDPTALDMTAQLSKLKAAKPDALIISGYGTAALYAFTSRAKMGWTDIPTYGDQLASTFPLASQLSSAQLQNVKVVVGSSSLATSGDFPARDAMVKAIKAGKYGASIQQVGVAVYIIAYDIPMLYETAAKQAKSTDPDKVAKALENLTDPSPLPWLQGGPQGDWVKYAYSSTDHFPTPSDAALQYVNPGSFNADGLYVPGT